MILLMLAIMFEGLVVFRVLIVQRATKNILAITVINYVGGGGGGLWCLVTV